MAEQISYCSYGGENLKKTVQTRNDLLYNSCDYLKFDDSTNTHICKILSEPCHLLSRLPSKFDSKARLSEPSSFLSKVVTKKLEPLKRLDNL